MATEQTERTCPKCGTVLPASPAGAACPKCLLEVGLGSQPDAEGSTQPVSQPTPPPTPAELAPHFPQLEILELIGQGGMGVVYRARQPRLDRLVALKILPTEAARDPAFAERFTREAQALARLAHPNIVAVYDFGETNGMFYLLMEHVDGANLRQLEQAAQLSPAEALQIVPAICSALQFAHDQGIVHRDIKPENILVDKQGRVKIADFGLAKLLGRPASGSNLTRVQQVMGTPHYMAPEQVETPQKVDHRADIYSLGVVFYEMLTGELPIGRFAPPSWKVQVDVRLDQVVLRTLEKERERRYQKVSDVKTDLEAISASPDTPAASMAAGERRASAAAEAFRAVKGPAVGLIVTGILDWVLTPLCVLVGGYLLSAHGVPTSLFSGAGLALVLVLVGSSFMIFAGLKMKALEAYGAALAGSIVAILLSPGNIIGLPIGIWALVTLRRSSVRDVFMEKAKGGSVGPYLPGPTPTSPTAADGARRWFFATATALMIGLGLFVLLILGLLVFSIVMPALHRARNVAQEIAATAPARAATEEWLKKGIAEHLEGVGFQYDTMWVILAPQMNSGRCSFRGLRREPPAEGARNAGPISGELQLMLAADDAWHIQGSQGLLGIEFELAPLPAAATQTNRLATPPTNPAPDKVLVLPANPNPDF